MTAIVTAGAGFLLAVLWFDLMFDAQVLRHPAGRAMPERVLDSIAGYYRRVTTEAHPMGLLVGAVMLVTLAAIVVQIAEGESPTWVGVAALILTLLAVGTAALITFPAAVRLGARSDPPEEQSGLARTILRTHVFCLTAIAAVLVIELVWA